MDPHENDLELTIINDGVLYEKFRLPLERQLAKYKEKGTYSHRAAVKGWRNFVDEGARKYAKDAGFSSRQRFPSAMRDRVAERLATQWEEEYAVQSNPKKRRRKNVGYMNKTQFEAYFRKEYMPNVRDMEKLWGRQDPSFRSQTWSEAIDHAEKAGMIDPTKSYGWSQPAWLKGVKNPKKRTRKANPKTKADKDLAAKIGNLKLGRGIKGEIVSADVVESIPYGYGPSPGSKRLLVKVKIPRNDWGDEGNWNLIRSAIDMEVMDLTGNAPYFVAHDGDVMHFDVVVPDKLLSNPGHKTKRKTTRRKKNPHYRAGSAEAKRYDPHESYPDGVIVSPDERWEGTLNGIHVLAVRVGDRWANVHPLPNGAYGIRWWMLDYEWDEMKGKRNPKKTKRKTVARGKVKPSLSKTMAKRKAKMAKNPKARKRKGYTIVVHDFGGDWAYEATHPEHPKLEMVGYASESKAFGAANRAIDKAVGLRATRAFFDNPTAAKHEKTGMDALKKSENYWERYDDKGRINDLLNCYKFLIIAHEELKYSGKKEPRIQARDGLKAVRREILSVMK